MFYRQILGAILLVFSFGACGKQKEINEENTSKSKPSSVFVSQSQEDKDSHKKMLNALSIIKLSTNDKNKYLGDLRARQVRDVLNKTELELSKEKKWFYKPHSWLVGTQFRERRRGYRNILKMHMICCLR